MPSDHAASARSSATFGCCPGGAVRQRQAGRVERADLGTEGLEQAPGLLGREPRVRAFAHRAAQGEDARRVPRIVRRRVERRLYRAMVLGSDVGQRLHGTGTSPRTSSSPGSARPRPGRSRPPRPPRRRPSTLARRCRGGCRRRSRAPPAGSASVRSRRGSACRGRCRGRPRCPRRRTSIGGQGSAGTDRRAWTAIVRRRARAARTARRAPLSRRTRSRRSAAGSARAERRSSPRAGSRAARAFPPCPRSSGSSDRDARCAAGPR